MGRELGAFQGFMNVCDLELCNLVSGIHECLTPSKIKTNISCLIWQILTELDGEEYLAAAVDPIAQFTAPIAVK